MILLALLKMKIDRNRKKKVHLHPSVSISMFGFERVQFRVGAVASLYSTAGWILYRICRRTRFHNPGCHYLVQGFILPLVELLFSDVSHISAVSVNVTA